MKVQTTVVGYDGSDNAQLALSAAVDLLADDGTIHIVTAYGTQSEREYAQIMEVIPDEYRSGFDMLAGPRGRLNDAERKLRSQGVDHKAHFVNDKPAAAILDVADDVGADMIVVGSRGLGRGSRFIRGSVSTRIANHARKSFMVIHEDDDSK